MKAPKWAAWVAVIVCLPLLSLPWMIADSAPDSNTKIMLSLYPLVVVLGAFCAWKCMPERPEVFWILVAVILLVHAAMWVLVNPLIVLAL